MSKHESSPFLDPRCTALIVIDVQRALFRQRKSLYEAETLLLRLNELIRTWREAGALLVFIQHSNNKQLVKGTEGWQFHPDLDVQASDPVVHKLQGNAFEGTDLKSLLEARGVGTLVISGLVTHGCVKATTLGGLELGYRVILVKDGHSSYSQDALQLIEKWNGELARKGADVLPAAALHLAMPAG